MSPVAPPLILDVQASQMPTNAERGIARYVRGLATALVDRPGFVCRLMLSPMFPAPAHPLLPSNTVPPLAFNTAEEWKRAEADGGRFYLVTAPFENLSQSFEYVLPPHAIRSGCPVGVILYDLIPLVNLDTYYPHPSRRSAYKVRLGLIKTADIVLALSEFSRNEAIERLGIDPRRICVIGCGVDPLFSPASVGAVHPPQLTVRPGITRPYVFTVLGDDPRKNLPFLLDAYSRLPQAQRLNLQLVIGGNYPDATIRSCRLKAEAFGWRQDDVVFTRKVDDSTMVDLYRCARLFVFPSLSEGFGLPVAEAAACGCPAISSNTTALPEVLNWPPSTFDPANAAELASLMERALGDMSFRKDLVDAGMRAVKRHRWNLVADKVVEAVNGCLAASVPRASRVVRPRLALVGPLPPAATGVADYNAEVARALSRHCDLDLYSDERPGRDEWFGPGVRLFPIGAMGRMKNPLSYDRILYTIGNGQHYHGVREMALKYPGVVWLHDVFIAASYLTYAFDRVDAVSRVKFLRKLLNEMYPARELPPASDGDLLQYEWYRGHNLGLVAELASHAQSILIHSPHARDLLLKDWGPCPFPVPIHVVRSACHHSSQVPVERGEDGTAWIVTLGIQDVIKRPLVLFSAFAELARERQGLRLAYVGYMQDELQREIEQAAASQGYSGRVVITGRLPGNEFERWISRATVAVQLRAISHGESSGVIGQCLSSGTPVISNMLGTRHWPENVVVKLPADFAKEMLVDALRRVLDDEAWRTKLSRDGRDFAGQNTFTHLAGDIFKCLDL